MQKPNTKKNSDQKTSVNCYNNQKLQFIRIEIEECTEFEYCVLAYYNIPVVLLMSKYEDLI